MTTPRRTALPVAAVVAVAAVVGVQLMSGGGRYEPLRPPSACDYRPPADTPSTIDALTERLVLIGLADAACDLGVGREALTLELAQSGRLTDAQLDAMRSGLLAAVDQMAADGTLPPVSALLDEALASSGLPDLVVAGLRLVPTSVVDAALRTDDVLTRTVDGLDLRSLLADLDDPAQVEDAVEVAVTRAVTDALVARVTDVF